MLDYQSLAALGAIVREGSFERAAAALGVTPSAVSQRIRALEERVGTVLVVRGQPCRATPAGARLCAHVDQVRLLEDDVVAALPALAERREAGRATLRVAVNADSLNTWFPDVAAAFFEQTGALLDLVLEDEGHTAEHLRSGAVQAAVTADAAPVQGCRTASLGVMRYAAVASPGFIAHHFPEGVDRRSLASAPMLRFNPHDGLQARWMREAHGADGGAAPAHWVPSTQGFLDLALRGVGWGMNPLMLANEHLAAGRLVELPPERRVDIVLYWQSTRLGASLLDALGGAVRDVARRALIG